MGQFAMVSRRVQMELREETILIFELLLMARVPGFKQGHYWPLVQHIVHMSTEMVW